MDTAGGTGVGDAGGWSGAGQPGGLRLAKARAVFARADVTGGDRLLTTSPHSYYEETSGATTSSSVPPRSRWRARRCGCRLAGDLAAQLRVARARYAAPLAFGGDEDPGADFASGVAVTERLYRQTTGSSSFAAQGASMRDWALGANAWGTSLVIGAGTTYPQCPHHQVANILGARPGAGGVLLGGVSNGPASASYCTGLGRHGAYAATEPALDYVAVSVLAFVLEANE
ncbi:MAG: glycoside hydrolase family 9 protein [Nocardioides sp.]|nr:glycoside hydrolase family 9 protein [Nocardioides sp.]